MFGESDKIDLPVALLGLLLNCGAELRHHLDKQIACEQLAAKEAITYDEGVRPKFIASNAVKQNGPLAEIPINEHPRSLGCRIFPLLARVRNHSAQLVQLLDAEPLHHESECSVFV